MSMFQKIKWTLILVALTSGGVWLLNLPYPMIRRPVASTAPLLLLPSYLSMDHNYRRAVSLVEQADQLVNQATSADDFELGKEKVRQAQTHLDALPVWFLGYEPTFYCRWVACSWRFTYDEFAVARASIGRMESKIFQEQNAQTRLQEADAAAQTAKQDYQQAPSLDQQQVAIAAWQVALDQLNEIPNETVAGKLAQTKLTAYTRDFQQVVGVSAGSSQSSALVEAAKAFGLQAAQLSQNPPHPVSQWEEIARLWEVAIARLTEVKSDNPGYLTAQQLLATYETNLAQIRIRLRAEQEAATALTQAKSRIAQLLRVESQFPDRNRQIGEIQTIIDELSTIRSGTTAHGEAQVLKQSAQQKLSELQS